MLPTQPPSLQLPPVRSLTTLSPETLVDCVEYLRVLYTPGVRGSKIRRRFSSDFSDSQKATSSALPPPVVPNLDLDNAADTAALRSDEFERAYTIRWLTYLINNVENLQGTDSDVDSVVSRAAALLANCGGASSAGLVTRTLEFPSAHDVIRITLRDIPLENGDIASVGAQTWGGACVLSEIIASQPADFGLVPSSRRESESPKLRVLELGAGTRLVGLVLATVAKSMGVGVTIVSTDFYPSVLQNLATNISVAFPDPERSPISSHFLDWSSFSTNPDPLPQHAPLDEPFDVILGADIIYEAEHAAWIHACVSRLLDRGTSKSQFHLVIPLRRTHTLESSSVELVFRDRDRNPAHGQEGPSAPSLTILSKETILCDIEEHANNTAEEVEYVYYRIGWKEPRRLEL